MKSLKDMAALPDVTPLPTIEEIEASRAYWSALGKVPVVPPTAAMSEARVTEIFNSLPDGVQGFCKSWGYLTFAKCLLLNKLYQEVSRGVVYSSVDSFDQYRESLLAEKATGGIPNDY